MKTINRLIFLALLLCICSCAGINKAVEGFWSIDRLEYKNQDLLYDVINIISFRSENCNLPTHVEDYKVQSKKEGTWEVTQEGEQYYLTIQTKNEIFAGKHKICFKKDYKNKLIKMFITSKNLFVECRKGLFNFDKDNKSINDYLCK